MSPADQPIVVDLGGGMEFRVVPIDDLEPDPRNPNKEDLATFNELVEGIKRDGVVETLLVRPAGETGKWVITAGEHRWKAAKLAGVTHVPILIKQDWDADEAGIQLVRLNALRGRLDPERFTKLYTELKGKFSEPELRKRLGFSGKDAEFRRLLKSVTAGLPASVRAEVEKRAEKIRRVEDLAAVVQSIFTKYGATVAAHFIVFAFGGQTHLMVQTTPETFGPILALAEACQAAGRKTDEVLARRAACACGDCMALLEPASQPVG